MERISQWKLVIDLFEFEYKNIIPFNLKIKYLDISNIWSPGNIKVPVTRDKVVKVNTRQYKLLIIVLLGD